MPRARIRPKRGGDKKLDNFRKAIEKSPDVLRVISRNGAEEIVGLVKEGFRKEQDPYGKRWAPKKIPDGRKVLSGKTSDLKGGWHVVKAGKGGFTVAPSVEYAIFHQRGTRFIPQRRMVPDGRLPNDWASVLRELAEEILTAHFRDASGGSGMSVPSFGKIGFRLSSAKSVFRLAMRGAGHG